MMRIVRIEWDTAHHVIVTRTIARMVLERGGKAQDGLKLNRRDYTCQMR